MKVSGALTYCLPGDCLYTTNDPGGVEPPVGVAVIGQAGDIPMADEGGIGIPHRRAAADEHHSSGVAGQHRSRRLARADGHHGALGPGPIRDRIGGGRAGDQDMAAGQLEKSFDILDIGPLGRAFPGQAAIEAELTALTDGAYASDVAHLAGSTTERPVGFNSAFSAGRRSSPRSAWRLPRPWPRSR